MPRLNIAVFGAGSIGCHLGGMLAGSAQVTLIGRQAAMAAVEADGLTLTRFRGPATHVAAKDLILSTSADGVATADVVLVTVKSGDTEAATRQLAPHLRPGTPVVGFQNGLRNAAVLRGVLTGNPVLAGMVPYNVVRTGAASFHQGSDGRLMIEQAPAGQPLVALMRGAGLSVRARRDMPQVQHAKLLMNLNNAVNALSGLPLRDQLGQRAYRLCLAACQAEALAAMRAAGVRPARLGPVPARLTPALLRLPDALFRRVAVASLRIDGQARSSMWEDLRRGRPTEIDSLQGEVVAMAERHGLAAPANARLSELVRQAEGAGAQHARQWSGCELLAQVRQALRA